MSASLDSHLLDTRRAFDSVAGIYDGPIGNNALIQRMRGALWRAMLQAFPSGVRLLDLGCGTGIDAVYFASHGHTVVATDWSPQMVQRTRERAAQAGLSERVSAREIGIQNLEELAGERFDGIYSDLGPLNCVPDLRAVARSCVSLLRPQGLVVASVIGRICPWEFAYYAARGDRARARLRGAWGSVPVTLNGETVWTRYYSPREFYAAFSDEFSLKGYRALNLFLPPPYLIRIYGRLRPLFSPLAWLDDRLDAWPPFREGGDHFLMVLAKRG